MARHPNHNLMKLAAKAGYRAYYEEGIITDGSTPQTDELVKLTCLLLNDIQQHIRGREKMIELCRRAGFDICTEESVSYVLDIGNRNMTHMIENLMREITKDILELYS